MTENGAWEQGGEPLHPKVALLFSTQVVPTGPAEFEIQIGHQRQRVEVRDAAYFVRSISLQRDAEGSLSELKGQLSDGREEVLDQQALSNAKMASLRKARPQRLQDSLSVEQLAVPRVGTGM